MGPPCIFFDISSQDICLSTIAPNLTFFDRKRIFDVLFYREKNKMTLDFVKNKLLLEEDRQHKSVETSGEHGTFASNREQWQFRSSLKKNTERANNSCDCVSVYLFVLRINIKA